MPARTRHMAAAAALAGAALLAVGCQPDPATSAPGRGPAPAPTLITGTIGGTGSPDGVTIARPPARYDFRLCVAGNGVYGVRSGSGPGKLEIVKDDPACTSNAQAHRPTAAAVLGAGRR